jgi:CBS domain-containing protein
MGVPVSVLLERKGTALEAMGLDATLAEAAERMAARTIGSVVVTYDDGTLAGLLSERDIVREIASSGPAALEMSVSVAMLHDPQTCDPTTGTDHLMRVMTEQRVRHVPVVDGTWHLVGLVSIGDVVKWQLEELTNEAEQLQAYVRGSSY